MEKIDRCYRCGAVMNDSIEICPECGFNLNAPVEIKMYRSMMGPEIIDEEERILWQGSGDDTAFIDAPQPLKITIRWGADQHEERVVVNGEAYRFERGAMGKGFEIMKKTRRKPKR